MSNKYNKILTIFTTFVDKFIFLSISIFAGLHVHVGIIAVKVLKFTGYCIYESIQLIVLQHMQRHITYACVNVYMH